MVYETKELLNEVIISDIQKLSQLDSGSDEKSKAIEDLTKLYRLKIEETKTENEALETRAKSRMNKEQVSEQVKDRYFKAGIAVGELILPLIFYAVWMARGFKFEETGTFTSKVFMGLFNRFRPTK